MSKEIWKDVPGYEGYYQVSNIGNIRSVDRIVGHPVSKKLRLKSKNIKKVLDQTGYYYFSASKHGVAKRYAVHRVLMEALCPTENMGNLQVNHIDLNKTNNLMYNLEWVTPKENINHAISEGVSSAGRKGEKSARAKLKNSQAVLIRVLFNTGLWSKSKLSREFCVSTKAIDNIINLKSYLGVVK